MSSSSSQTQTQTSLIRGAPQFTEGVLTPEEELILCAAFGGTRIYIPGRWGEYCARARPLQILLGEAASAALSARFGGENLKIPSLPGAERTQWSRRTEIDLLMQTVQHLRGQGAGIAEIALFLRVSDRTISRICNEIALSRDLAEDKIGQ